MRCEGTGAILTATADIHMLQRSTVMPVVMEVITTGHREGTSP